MKTTISVIKADVGSPPGDIPIDFYVARCEDDTELITAHNLGVGNEKVHELAWNVFTKATDIAEDKNSLSFLFSKYFSVFSCNCFHHRHQRHFR